MSVQHFLLTRFNIASTGREARIRSRRGWLDRRFVLFQDYCLPSIAGQDATNFDWLIYFDESTAPRYRDQINGLRKQFPFEPIYVTDFRPDMAVADITKRLNEATKRVITTRLDNDDGLASWYLSAVRFAATKAADDTIIEFSRGLELHSQRLYAAVEKHGPFVSMIESRQHFRTIWSHQHQLLKRHYKTEFVGKGPAWLRVIHGDNVSNRVRGRLLANGNAMSNFPIDIEAAISSPAPWAVAIDRLLFFPMRHLKECARAAAKSAYRLLVVR